MDNSAFFFDVSMLFEYFVRKLLIRNGSLLQSKFERRLEIPRGTLKKSIRKLEPDIVIEKENGVHVFDVKYKSFNFFDGVKREDLFQLHTYVGQYMNKFKVKSCGFIYPIEEEKWEKYSNGQENPCIKETLEISGERIPFIIFFIVVPKDQNSKEFSQLFAVNNAQFLKLINELN